MADRLTLELATPIRLLLSETVDEVVAPGSEGYFGVLPGHAPFLTTLGIGLVTYKIGGQEHHVVVSGGFAEVRNDKVIILADTAERPDEVDLERAERARQRAESRVFGRTQDDVDYTRAMAALLRAQTRLQAVAGRA